MDAASVHLAKRTMLRDHLQRRGIRDRRVLQAIERVPREKFVPEDSIDDAYSDRALPIDCGQTISQPYIVALMTEALALKGGEKVLEIGTGSGYQAAILAELAGRVVTVERHANLSEQARRRLADLGYGNLRFVQGDGSQGFPEEAPYDRIIVTAAAPVCPEALFKQLAEGGVLVIPVGIDDEQMLERWTKQSGKLACQSLGGCRFVPLVAGGD
ncbi:MAG TPA: protein-L-isoaspartate(D-aspartate) O-methyltransferase [Pirellulales bacterium]|nr:protein-L-isoaspartate(D-aspartate) O-methyltransferase [Pirellulales bacterium]